MSSALPTNPAPPAQAGPTPEILQLLSLLGTMSGGQISGLSQADLQNQQGQLHQQVQQASQQADQATKQYQQAAAQPPEQPTNFYDQLLGNTASVLSGKQQYSQQAADRLSQHISSLDSARLHNLQALKDAADQKASLAEKLGNTSAALDARQSSEQIATKMKVLLEAAKELHSTNALATTESGKDSRQATAGGQRIDQIHTTGQEARLTKASPAWVDPNKGSAGVGVGVNRDTSMDPIFDGMLTPTDFGSFIENKPSLTAKMRPALAAYAADKGAQVLEPKQVAAILDMETSWATLKTQADQIRDKLADGPQDRVGKAAQNMLAKTSGFDPELAAFDSMWANTVRTMRAQAGAGGLRINKSEIDRAIKWDRPNPIWDTKPILDQKMLNWSLIRAHAISPLMTNDWRSVKPGGKVRVMGPDGSVKELPQAKAEVLLAKKDGGYARVLDESDFPTAAASQSAAPSPSADPEGLR